MNPRVWIVSSDGTFGKVERRYVDGMGVRRVIIRWGPLQWLTPAVESECLVIYGDRSEEDARGVAERWLKRQEPTEDDDEN